MSEIETNQAALKAYKALASIHVLDPEVYKILDKAKEKLLDLVELGNDEIIHDEDNIYLKSNPTKPKVL